MKQTPEMTRAMSGLTIKGEVFFTSLLYTLKIEPKPDLPAPAATDGVHLYYQPEQFAKDFTDTQRVFVLVHEILHVVLMHSLRRGIRDPKRWNVACDHVVNLLCNDYGFPTPTGYYNDTRYKGMTAEQVYDLLPEDAGKGEPQDVLDYNPDVNDGKTRAEVEREVAINTSNAVQAAKAAGKDSAALKRMIGEAQVQREPWYQHLRRYMTTMNARNYNWSRINVRHAILHGVVTPQQKSEQMGKVVFGIDCSGSITEKQLSAMGAHLSDILKDVTPSEVVIMYFDSEVCHVDAYTDMNAVALTPHGGGGTDFDPVFVKVAEDHSDAQLVVMFTDLYGSFGDGCVCDVLWVSQTERVEVPFGELIYGDLNEG
jgi:predicted metal-dependent peptidase